MRFSILLEMTREASTVRRLGAFFFCCLVSVGFVLRPLVLLVQAIHARRQPFAEGLGFDIRELDGNLLRFGGHREIQRAIRRDPVFGCGIDFGLFRSRFGLVSLHVVMKVIKPLGFRKLLKVGRRYMLNSNLGEGRGSINCRRLSHRSRPIFFDAPKA